MGIGHFFWNEPEVRRRTGKIPGCDLDREIDALGTIRKDLEKYFVSQMAKRDLHLWCRKNVIEWAEKQNLCFLGKKMATITPMIRELSLLCQETLEDLWVEAGEGRGEDKQRKKEVS